jgi:hypothetical protein
MRTPLSNAESIEFRWAKEGKLSVRTSNLKLLILAFVLVAGLAMVPAASANSFTITSNNLGLSGTLGTVTTTQSGNNVVVTISMSPGYAIVSQGGFIGLNTTAGLSLGDGSLTSFSIKMSAGLQPNGHRIAHVQRSLPNSPEAWSAVSHDSDLHHSRCERESDHWPRNPRLRIGET